MDPIPQTPTPGWRLFRLLNLAIRLRPALLLLGAGIVAYGFYQHFAVGGSSPPSHVEELRIPVANPVLEPDRPDLLGEPRIDE